MPTGQKLNKHCKNCNKPNSLYKKARTTPPAITGSQWKGGASASYVKSKKEPADSIKSGRLKSETTKEKVLVWRGSGLGSASLLDHGSDSL